MKKDPSEYSDSTFLTHPNSIPLSQTQSSGSTTPKQSSPRDGTAADKNILANLLTSGLAGGIAGVAGKTCVAPLDRVKILFQTHNPMFTRYIGSPVGFIHAIKHIIHHEGPFALFRGHSATILRNFPYAGIRFLSYEQIRTFLIPSKKFETSPRRFLSGSLAGGISVVFTYPLEVLRVRLAFATEGSGGSRSLVGIAKEIYREGTTETQHTGLISRLRSLANFYRGFSPTMLGMIPYAGTSFLAHDAMGDLLRHPVLSQWTLAEIQGDSVTTTTGSGKRRLRWWAQLIAGGSAGLVAQTVSYPLEVIRRCMQVGYKAMKGSSSSGRRPRTHEVAKLIYMERGIRGFYTGLGIGFIKIVPMFAVTFFVYERVRAVFGV
ncbi:mitochondrial carrier domain-containing protein [Aspergillus karnatakaensis]|uniref:mitochondrial carrier domain-containing protein n=1 Tax=Aspergillus karnatakaensis TaxID=1810916 RepID=UPI003CCCB31B